MLKKLLAQRKTLIILIAVFGAVGTFLIIQSGAATYVISLEAESGTRSGNTGAGIAEGASNSQSVKFGVGTIPTTPPTTPPPTTPPPTAPPATPSAGAMYITPTSGSYKVGESFVVEVHVNAGTNAINAAQADLAYSSNLQYVSSDVSSSPLDIKAQNDGGSGVATIALGTVTPASGDILVAKVTFKVLSVGTGTIDVKDSSIALLGSNSSNMLTTRTDGSYILQQ